MIKNLYSEQVGAPILSGSAGSLLALLQAVLVDGYGSQTLDTLESTGTVATATVNAGHGLSNYDTVLIEGAAHSEYNGEFSIFNCSTTQFSYNLPSAAYSPTTGMITCKIPPLGWEKTHSDTTRAIYRPYTGLRRYYKFDEEPVSTISIDYGGGYMHARAFMYESIIDISVGVPENTMDCYIRKSRVENTDPSKWYVIGDGTRFYLFIAWYNAASSSNKNYYEPYYFGDFLSVKSVDLDASCVIGEWVSYSNDGIPIYLTINTLYSSNIESRSKMDSLKGFNTGMSHNLGLYMMRDSTGMIDYADFFISDLHPSLSDENWSSTLNYPNLINNALYFSEVFLVEDLGLRGRLPGIYAARQKIPNQTVPEFTEKININGTDRTLLCFRGGSESRIRAIDMTGPWE